MKDGRSGVNMKATVVAGFGALAVAGLCYAGGSGVTITTLVKQGETIPGYGEVGSLPIDVNVNDSGYWLTTLPTVNPTGRVILTPDGVRMADGDTIGGDYVVTSLANLHKGLNNNGDIVHRPTLEGPSGFSGVVWNNDTIIVRDQISTAPQFSPDTPYIGFFRAKVNDAGHALLMATVNDSELTGTVHRAMVWLEYDDSRGTLTENVLFKRYDEMPGQPKGVIANEFGTNSERWAINNNGDAIFAVDLTGGDSATNAAIYVNDTLVAQKGDFGPFKDVTYNMGTSSTTRVDINDHGDYIMLMPLAGGPTAENQAIIRNNIHSEGADELVIRKGDPVPGVDGAIIATFGTGQQFFITNNGDIVWFASWTGDSGTERGLFVNDQLIIHAGVTQTPDEDVITNLGTTNTSNGIGDTFQVSRNGRYIISRVVLNASTSERAVILVDLGEPEPKCAGPADLNCDGVVDVSDLLMLLSAWGDCPRSEGCVGDLNDDGVVDVSDLLILLSSWG